MDSIRPLHRLSLAIAMALGAPAGHAATITVTTGGDAGTAATCTLRQAIESANNDASGTSNCAAGNGADTIVFAAALANSTITLAAGELTINSPLTVAGSGQTISANSASRIATINTADATLSDLTLRDGNALLGTYHGSGALRIIDSAVAMTNVTVTANQGYYAGGISVSNSTFTATDSVVSDNTTTNNSHGNGGGVLAIGNTLVTLNASTISGNSTGHQGGGMYVGLNAALAMYGSTVSGNTVVAGGAAQSGGGIFGYRCAKIALTDSAVTGNTGHFQGGGILANNCQLTLINTTVSGNASEVSSGGGVYVEDGTSAQVVNSTISGNAAQESGGILVYKDTTLTLANTLISANTVNANYLNTADLQAYGVGNTISASYCLMGSALNGPFAGNHNVFSDAPLLGPLQNNGGPTQTMALLSGSPAIDAGSNALAKNGTTALVYDQRAPLFPRIFNAKADIGAFEFQGERIFSNGFEPGP